MSWRFLPNAICIVRIMLVGPLVWLIVEGRYAEALAVLLVAGVSDGLDGFLAKTFDWRTRLGGLLDPAADKLLLVSVFLALTYAGLVPVAVTAVVVARDVVIVLGAIAYQLLIAPVKGEPSVISKLNTASQLALVFFTLTSVAFAWPPRVSLLTLGASVSSPRSIMTRPRLLYGRPLVPAKCTPVVWPSS
jgi:cardiolipin synthase